MREQARARIALIASMTVFGTIGIFRRYIPLPSSFLAMTRGAGGVLFLLLVMLLRRRKPDLSAVGHNLLLLLISGAAIGVNWILLFEAYNYTSVATATLCYYFAPFFTILLSPVFLREKLRAKPLCIVMALLGMVFVSGVLETKGGAGDFKGILFGLGAAALYASVVLMNKRMGPIDAYDKTAVQLAAAVIVLVPYVLLTGAAENLSFTPLTIVMLLVVCMIHTGLAYTLYFGSFAHLPAQTLALFSYIDPVVAVLLSALLLKEPMTLLMALGAVLILGAAVWSELPEREKNPARNA